MINDDLVGMENNLEFFSACHLKKTVTPSMQFHPILSGNVVSLVVRGLVALWLWCPHLLIDIDCMMLHPGLNTHTYICSPPHAHRHTF